MASQKDINLFNEVWKKVLVSSGIPNPTGFPFELFQTTDSVIDTNQFDVTSTGSDSGSGLTAQPLKTIQAAINKVPNVLQEAFNINLGSGTFDGFTVASTYGRGTLRIIGGRTLATVATGVNTGTAGGSTTTTSLQKPAAASNWTANDLIGKWLYVSGGGGYSSVPVLRPILANTTTTLTVNAVTGMDSTTTFDIVDLTTYIGGITGDTVAIRAQNVDATVELIGLNFSNAASLSSLVEITGCKNVVLSGCQLSIDATVNSVKGSKNDYVKLQHCNLTANADVDISLTNDVDIHGVRCSGSGAIVIADSRSCNVTKLTSTGATGNVLRLLRIKSATGEVDASTSGATPIYLENIDDFTAVGTLLTGATNTGYGIEIQRAGRYTLTGSNITGASGDVYFVNHLVTWANLSSPSYGIVEEHAANAVANSSYTKAIKYGNYLYDGSIDVSGRLLLYGYFNQSANLSVPTLTGTTSYDMETNGVRGVLECICNSASAEVVLPSNCAIAGVIIGIVNRGSATLTVKPPVGGTINGGASTTILTNTSKTFVSLNGAGGKDFWILT